jgi:nucleoside 2-deoxyribosyltransferase
MKIVICGSMSASKQMVEAYDKLIKQGHEAILPRHSREYADNLLAKEDRRESINNKIEGDLIREYFEVIGKADAILVVNCDKNGITGYIGGNTFLEIGFAHVLGKPIYLLNKIPDMNYADEITAMRPVVLESDLNKII